MNKKIMGGGRTFCFLSNYRKGAAYSGSSCFLYAKGGEAV